MLPSQQGNQLNHRIRLLKDHSDPPANLDGVDLRRIKILIIESHTAFESDTRDQIIEEVEAAQHGTLTATGRPDERRNAVLRNIQRDVSDCPVVAVKKSAGFKLLEWSCFVKPF